MFENDGFILRWDKHAVSPGHLLVITKRHIETVFDMSVAEWAALQGALEEAKRLIGRDHQPDGYNIGTNVGAAAGQTIAHFHLHIIPRYQGDIPNPAGGIRNVLPGKGSYQETVTGSTPQRRD